jgi:hypothetical protein
VIGSEARRDQGRADFYHQFLSTGSAQDFFNSLSQQPIRTQVHRIPNQPLLTGHKQAPQLPPASNSPLQMPVHMSQSQTSPISTPTSSVFENVKTDLHQQHQPYISTPTKMEPLNLVPNPYTQATVPSPYTYKKRLSLNLSFLKKYWMEIVEIGLGIAILYILALSGDFNPSTFLNKIREFSPPELATPESQTEQESEPVDTPTEENRPSAADILESPLVPQP